METNHDHKLAPPRPAVSRKRSNSFPIIEALGCSAAEASLVLAEGRAAISRRQADRDGNGRRVRRHKSVNETSTSHRSKEFFSTKLAEPSWESTPGILDSASHKRTPSEQTVDSTSTITGPGPHSAPASPGNPLGAYSANLAKFIQSQLNSISSYRTTPPLTIPRSCPDLTEGSRSKSQSPTRAAHPHTERPNLIDIPPPRPPLRSAFSAWSSTDESGNDTDDDVPPLPTMAQARQGSKTSIYTYSTMLNYYENSTPGSFLFPPTPIEPGNTSKSEARDESESRPTTRASRSYSQSRRPSLSKSTSSPGSSLNPKLTSSSFTSVGSYFDHHPLSLDPEIKDKIIAAVSPYERNTKIINAISPFEGAPITRVHDIFIKSPKQVVLEGTAFEMLREMKMPTQAAGHVTTPC